MTTDRLRILHLQTDDGVSGGIANYISTLVKAGSLALQCNFVVAPALRSHRQDAEEMYPGATVVRLPGDFGPRSFVNYYGRLRHLIEALDVDLVHAHALRCALPAAAASKRLDIPLVYTNHGLRYTQKAGSMMRRTFLATERFVTKRASAVVAIRPYDLERMKADAAAPSDRSYLVQTRLNQLPSSGRKSQNLRPMLLGVGSLIPVKRPLLFLEWALALQSQGLEFNAVWAGDGPLLREMVAAAEAMHVPVTFVGHQSRPALAELYNKADLLLLSSEFETFSMAVLEAMAHGVPTVTSNFPGVGNLISDGVTGIVVDDPKVERVAISISSLLRDNSKWLYLSRNCTSIYRDQYFRTDVMADSYLEIYRNVITGRGQRRD
jgi:L-malate glycosyltransferase